MADETAVDFLVNEKLLGFNNYVDSLPVVVDLSDAKLRARDLRGCRLDRANLQNAYLRLCDLRGLDLSEANLEGASIKDAKISGVLFPQNLDPQEIMMSLVHGTRLRLKN